MADEVLKAVVTAEGVKEFQEDLDRANSSVAEMEAQSRRASDALNSMEASAVQAGEALSKTDSGSMAQVSSDARAVAEDMEKLREQYGLAEGAIITTGDAALDAAAKAEKLGDDGEKGAGRAARAFDGLGESARRVLETMLGFNLAQISNRIFGTIRDEIASTRTLFQQQEDAVVSLGIAYGSLGKFQSAAIKDMQAWASELQKATSFGDEAILSTAALISQLGRITGDELKEATEAAIQFAAVLGRDVSTGALLVAKAAQGQTQELSRYGIVLREGIPASEKFAEVLRLINQNFGGTAQLRARTMSGQVRALSAAWGDAKEAFGAASAFWIPTLQKMTTAFAAVAEKINPNFLRVFDTEKALDDLTVSFEEQARAVNQAKNEFLAYGQIGGATGQQMRAIYGNLASDIKQTAVEAKTAASQALETFETVVRFKLSQGDVSEIQAQIAAIKKALAEATDPEAVARLLKLLGSAVANLRLRIQLDKEAFTEDVRRLQEIAQRIPLEIEASFVTRPVDQYLAELERRRPEIEASMDLDAGALADLQKYEQTVRLEAPDLPLEQFVQLGAEARDAFIAAFNKPDKTDADWDKILRMGDLLRFLEGLRIPRVPIEWEWQGPQFIPIDTEPVNRIQKEFDLLRRSILELGQLGGIAPTELLNLEALEVSAANLETLRQKISTSVEAIKASVESQLATIRIDAIDKLKAAGDDQAERARIIAEADRAQTEALGPLLAAYQQLIELERIYVELLGQVPATSAAAINQSKKDLLEYAQAWTQANAATIDGFGRIVGTATDGFETIAIVGKATEDAIVQAFQEGSDKTVEIVTAMVDEILEQLARLTIRSFFEDLAKTVAVAAVVGKVEIPETPVEVPVTPVVEGGVIQFEGQVQSPSTSSLEGGDLATFTREIQASAAAREASRRIEVRVVQEPQPAPQALNVTLSGVNDGLSVRRQLTSGALRREILREASRGRL